MRQRPWALVILAILHFLAPIGNIVFNAVISNQNVAGYFVHAMSPGYIMRNWVILFAPLVAGFAIYVCKKWSFYVYLVAITGLFIVSYTGYQSKAESLSLIPILLVYLVNITVVGYFLIPAVRSIYFDRRLRWWEIQPRYKCNFKCQYRIKGSQDVFEGVVGNISENGLFLKADEHPTDGTSLQIILPFNHGVMLEFDGDAIIHGRVDAVGFGVKFTHTAASKKNAKDLIADLESKGMRISTVGGRPEDSFSYWIRTLISTGKGLVPSKEKNKS